ncbi:hypothetical protein ACU4GD_20170 [Cupriavidus basilensis]
MRAGGGCIHEPEGVDHRVKLRHAGEDGVQRFDGRQVAAGVAPQASSVAGKIGGMGHDIHELR